jgi:hypothetical protein
VRSGHAYCSPQERRPTPDLVQNQEGNGDGCELGDVENATESELELVVEAQLLEEGRGVVNKLFSSKIVLQ